MRTMKDPEERRKEILDKAQNLFLTKGYVKTTINDILNEVKIAKGTFYYYYKSKEEVLDAVVGRIVDEGVQKATEIVEKNSISAPEKLLFVLMSQKIEYKEEPDLLENIHNPDNAQMHQKSITEYVLKLSPIISKILEQGIEEGVFKTPYPRETVEILLTSGNILFDDGMFNWNEEEKMKKRAAFIYSAEVLSGAKQGTFSQLMKVFEN